jgi:hypothetical protein
MYVNKMIIFRGISGPQNAGSALPGGLLLPRGEAPEGVVHRAVARTSNRPGADLAPALRSTMAAFLYTIYFA